MTRNQLAIAVIVVAALAAILAVVIRRQSSVAGAHSNGVALISPEYSQKVRKITGLLESAPASQPSQAEAGELFEEVLHDPDFRVRVRAMAVLPFVRERERAIDVLIVSVHERDPGANGNGNVPLYATTYLADMRATRGIADVTDWVDYLEKHPTYCANVHDVLLKKGKEDLQRLKK